MIPVYNTAAIPLVPGDWTKPAVKPGDFVELDDEQAQSLASQEGWSLTAPEPAGEQRDQVPPPPPQDDPALAGKTDPAPAENKES